MNERLPYAMNMEVIFDGCELIDLPTLVDAVEDQWFNQTLTQVNDCVVRLGVMEGEFHWHKHEEEDEFFFCVDGIFVVETEETVFRLKPNQGVTIPKGVMHTTRTEGKAVILMVEKSSVIPIGDEG